MNSEQLIKIIQSKLEAWWIYLVQMAPNFVMAIIVVLLFFWGARLARKLTLNFVLRVSKSASITSLSAGIVYTLVIIAGGMAALDILELDKTVSSLLAGVGIIGLALGFAFQDLTSNFISGAFIAFKRPFDVGHIIETNGFQGTVEAIHLRATTIKTTSGLHVIIPNKEIFQKPIINYSKTEGRRVELEFVLPDSIDPEEIHKRILDTMYDIKEGNGIYGVEFYFTAIAIPNMKINVSFWTSRIAPRQFMGAQHQAIVAISKTLREVGVIKL
jgi:small conductance mechanosensitive channel